MLKIKAVIFDLNGVFLHFPRLAGIFQGLQPDNRVISFAESLRKKGIKVFILSNTIISNEYYYKKFPRFKTAVDKAYFSRETGIIKPDKEAWQQILKENNLRPEECFYFDDSITYVNIAKGLGLKSFYFESEEEMEKTVKKLIS